MPELTDDLDRSVRTAIELLPSVLRGIAAALPLNSAPNMHADASTLIQAAERITDLQLALAAARNALTEMLDAHSYEVDIGVDASRRRTGAKKMSRAAIVHANRVLTT